MLRWRGLDEVPADWGGRCVLTIGVFDGVHRGHAQLIARAVTAARKRGVPSVLMTFDPHPMEVVRPGSHPAQLTTLQRRAELAQDLGIDVFCVMPFTADFMKLTPERYVHEILVERLHVAEVVVGGTTSPSARRRSAMSIFFVKWALASALPSTASSCSPSMR